MNKQNVISFSEGKNNLEKKKNHNKTGRVVKGGKNFLIVGVIILVTYVVFTGMYYREYRKRPEDWSMSESRENEKKCKEFREIYKQKFDSREIKSVSDKCILAILQEEIDDSEIFHYYIGDDGKAAVGTKTNVEIDNDFLNPVSNADKVTSYRTIQIYPGYQDIIQATEVFYRIENGTISDSWCEFYKTILETKYDYYYIDNCFDGFFTNPPDCYEVNLTFYKNNTCKSVTLLIAKNEEREDEFYSYINNMVGKKWTLNEDDGSLEYLLKYSLNYPNESYTIPKMISNPRINMSDILLFSFRNFIGLDNDEPILCTSSSVEVMQLLQFMIFYFLVGTSIINLIFPEGMKKMKS